MFATYEHAVQRTTFSAGIQETRVGREKQLPVIARTHADIPAARWSSPPSSAELVERQVVLAEHEALPDGSGAIVVLRTVHGVGYRAHLRLVRFDETADAIELTSGAVFDRHPWVSPDGRTIAFIRSYPEEPARPAAVMIQDLAGGQPCVVWAPEHGLSEIALSPDGGQIAVVAASNPPRFIVGQAAPGIAPTARRITRLDWRRDGIGIRDRWSHLWVVDAVEGATPRRLTEGEFDVSDLAWAPDARTIAYVADPRPDSDLLALPSVWGISPGGGTPRELIHLAGSAKRPAFSPDGRWLACAGVDVPNPTEDVQIGLFVAPADGSAPGVPLAPDLDRHVKVSIEHDWDGGVVRKVSGPIWDGNNSILACVTSDCRAVPWRFPIDPATGRSAGAPVPIVAGYATCHTLGVGAGRVSVVATRGDGPPEVMTVEDDGEADDWRARSIGGPGVFRVQTGFGSWCCGVPWPAMRLVDIDGPAGRFPSWVASPEGSGDEPLPTILWIHGGPSDDSWGPYPSFLTVLLCAHGYRVVMPNPRGSSGFGSAWTRGLFGDWGGADMEDTLAALDAVIALGLVDESRVGVYGLSYGGYLTPWLIGAAPDRFAAAVSEEGCVNMISLWANGDEGTGYFKAQLGGDPLSDEGAALLWRESPLRLAPRIHTPLLILQGESDLTCPPENNVQLFVALRVLGREVEYVLYPDSAHMFRYNGRPDRRIDRDERMLAWFKRHLLDRPDTRSTREVGDPGGSRQQT
jgi:dipeptidyl aminopeptidase/acylaminoacyl peptidase